MLALNDRVRVVALKRPKDDTVKSFERWFGGLRHFPWVTVAERDHMPDYQHLTLYDVCYPKYQFEAEQPTIAEGASVYYDDYYAQVDGLLGKYPDRVRMYDSYDILNRRDLMEDLFNFLSIPEPRDYKTVTVGHPTDPQAAHQEMEKARHRAKDPASPRYPHHARRRPQQYTTRSFSNRPYRQAIGFS